ncbi:MAG TPA: NAD(P)-dependent oxidoreductase [Gemmatimonadaceae bacterium]|nr:NAD(P)-dependent oxidoreductase [Gemmatimonadaceae bacterium]
MNERIKKVAVTGSAGLIGGAVSRILEQRGVPVVGIDQSHGVDVADDAVNAALDSAAPDAVVHAAAHPGGRSLAEPVENTRVNALGSMRIFDWCARAKVPVVYLSSSVVYGDQPPGPIPETAKLQPGTVYGVAKVACEQWLDILGKGCGLEWTVLRLFATYGAGHRANTYQGIINVMLTQLLEGDRVVVRGSLDRQRDVIYVDDAARAIVDAVFTPRARGRILNVGSGKAVTVREIVETVATALGRNLSELEIIEEAGTVGDPFSNVGDCSRAREVLGFTASHTLLSGVQALLRERAQSS